MKLLIIGATGQVGQELCLRADALSIPYQAVSSSQLDITRESRVWWILRRAKPTIVINAAAYTAVDEAEVDERRCFAVNSDGVGHLAKVCRRMGLPLLHISTDYVFDGTKSKPYLEDDVPAPLGIYGQSKWQGEQLLASAWDEHIILRVSWVFSEWRQNFVKTMLRLSQEREELQVVEDQMGCPTPASDIARVAIAIAQQVACGAQQWGIFHYSAKGVTNWHEFARQIIELARDYVPVKTQQIIPITSDEYDFRAPRPLNSIMDCSKVLNTFGVQQRPWKSELARIVERLCARGYHEDEDQQSAASNFRR